MVKQKTVTRLASRFEELFSALHQQEVRSKVHHGACAFDAPLRRQSCTEGKTHTTKNKPQNKTQKHTHTNTQPENDPQIVVFDGRCRLGVFAFCRSFLSACLLQPTIHKIATPILRTHNNTSVAALGDSRCHPSPGPPTPSAVRARCLCCFTKLGAFFVWRKPPPQKMHKAHNNQKPQQNKPFKAHN